MEWVKNKMFYNGSLNEISIKEFIDILDKYLVRYNEKEIKLSLGAICPIEY